MGSHRCGVFLRRKGSVSLSLYLFTLSSLLGLDIHEKGHQVHLFLSILHSSMKARLGWGRDGDYKEEEKGGSTSSEQKINSSLKSFLLKSMKYLLQW